jgi:hypothetical protein
VSRGRQKASNRRRPPFQDEIPERTAEQRRADLAETRATMGRRRDAGLAQRHAGKLRRLAEADVADQMPPAERETRYGGVDEEPRADDDRP